jgi:lipid-A-disaccharide synthase-like uncharacterized protein
MKEYFTWEFLGTMAGAVAAVTLIVQFLKLPIDQVWKIPTRYIVFAISLLILFIVLYFTDVITPEKVALTILNAFVVAMASMGAYDVTFKKIEEKKENKPPG